MVIVQVTVMITQRQDMNCRNQGVVTMKELSLRQSDLTYYYYCCCCCYTRGLGSCRSDVGATAV